MSNAALVRRIRRAHTWAAVGSIAVVAASLTACGSSEEAGSSDTATSGAATSEGSDSASADLEQYTQPLDAYPVPTEPVGDVSSLAGKTIFYIPISQQAPAFQVAAKALTAAADTVGVDVQVCDGKGTPTDISACINRATSSQAGVIVADAIEYGLAGNAFDAAQAAGIPVIISNQLPDDEHPASDTLTYILPGGTRMDEALATWITADSGGDAQVIINMSTDGRSPAAYVAAAQDVYDESCPDCKVVINEISASSASLIPSSMSSALLQNPDVTYVESQFEQYVQAVQSGIQQTSRTGIKVVTGAATLNSVKAVEAGSLAAAAGQASAFQGWVDMDAALRLMLGTDVPDYTIPVRLFTQDTMDDVELTQEANESGAWFGPTTFPEDFQAVWGNG